MIHHLPDITEDINSNDPFAKCALGRRHYADTLTSIIEKSSHGVISLNGEWGTGKTTFVKMWDVYLKSNGFTTLYFNVWDNDYEVDPMVSLMSQLLTLFRKEKRMNNLKSVLGCFGKLIVKVGTPIGKGIAKKLAGVDIDEVVDGVKDATEEAVDELATLTERVLDNVSKEKEDIKAFRKALEAFVRKSQREESPEEGDVKPIVCFIDELDRCNPRYAVLVLERIKHIFSVPGIVFILSVDKKQLGNAIRGYYGSDRINADEYLRRFIDLDLNLPAISSEKYFEYLYKMFKFKSIFSKRDGYEVRGEHDSFKKVCNLLFERSSITLRQAEKMMSHVHLVLSSLASSQYFTAAIISILIFLRNTETSLYDGIKNKSYTVQGLIENLEIAFSNFFSVKHHNETPVRMFVFSLAEIVCMYCTKDYDRKSVGILEGEGKEHRLLVKLRNIPEDVFIEALSWEDRRFRYGTPTITSVIKHIELIGGMI